MKNNKILMSLVAASIAAMAAAPELMKTDSSQENENQENKEENKKLIDINKQTNLTPEQEELSKEAESQVSALLSKKAPIMRVSESISVLVDNYGTNNESTKEKIYKDLQLTQARDQDSTSNTRLPGASTTKSNTSAPPTATVCHSACHGACHAACHGSRGWR